HWLTSARPIVQSMTRLPNYSITQSEGRIDEYQQHRRRSRRHQVPRSDRGLAPLRWMLLGGDGGTRRDDSRGAGREQRDLDPVGRGPAVRVVAARSAAEA